MGGRFASSACSYHQGVKLDATPIGAGFAIGLASVAVAGAITFSMHEDRQDRQQFRQEVVTMCTPQPDPTACADQIQKLIHQIK
jgi:hypothetical protein